MSLKGFQKAAVRVCCDQFGFGRIMLIWRLPQAPQTFKAKFNLVRCQKHYTGEHSSLHYGQGDNTKDAVYIDSERRFQELEKVGSILPTLDTPYTFPDTNNISQETKKLHDESKKYFDSINGRLFLEESLRCSSILTTRRRHA